ncbi:MAG TPA: HPP family protein [Thiopseudomonas sp.]|nr:HPP family protein [Thiopseudomonas sp.]
MRAQWIKAFTPLSLNIPKKQWLRAACGAFLGVLACVICNYWLFGSQITLSLAAPIGASAVLLFVTSATPLAHPWSLLAGNLLSACVGVVCALYIDEPALRAAVAVLAAITSMLALRCLHPPSCALALTVALSPTLIPLGFAVLAPIMSQSVLMLCIALVFNNLTGTAYPRVPAAPTENKHNTADPVPSARTGFNEEDLDHALDEFGTYVDIRREDLEELLRLTEQHSFKRNTAYLTAASVMSRDLRTGHPEMPLEEAWNRLKEHRLHVLPVVDQHQRLVGIITLVDLLKYFELDKPVSRFHRLKYLRYTRLKHIMTTPVVSVNFDTPLIELVTLVTSRGLHAMPVIDEHRQLAGIITQTDIIAALYRSLLAQL